jgi:hypothetical protein
MIQPIAIQAFGVDAVAQIPNFVFHQTTQALPVGEDISLPSTKHQGIK